MIYTLLPNQTVKTALDDVEVEYIETTTIESVAGIKVTTQTMRNCIRKVKAEIKGEQNKIVAANARIAELQLQLSAITPVVAAYPIKEK